MRQSGLEAEILKQASRGTPVFGICGGLQMLGKTISDPYEMEGGGEIAGLGLLDIDTVFAKTETRTQTEGEFSGVGGIFSGLNGLRYRGYEIHMGQSSDSSAVIRNGNVYGSYIHGIFDENGIAETITEALYEARGLEFDGNAVFDVRAYKESQYDQLADTVRKALDMDLVYRILEEGV